MYFCVGDQQASDHQFTVNNHRAKRKGDEGLALDLTEDGNLSRPCINANLIELMMAAVDTASISISYFEKTQLFFPLFIFSRQRKCGKDLLIKTF